MRHACLFQPTWLAFSCSDRLSQIQAWVLAVGPSSPSKRFCLFVWWSPCPVGWKKGVADIAASPCLQYCPRWWSVSSFLQLSSSSTPSELSSTWVKAHRVFLLMIPTLMWGQKSCGWVGRNIFWKLLNRESWWLGLDIPGIQASPQILYNVQFTSRFTNHQFVGHGPLKSRDLYQVTSRGLSELEPWNKTNKTEQQPCQEVTLVILTFW